MFKSVLLIVSLSIFTTLTAVNFSYDKVFRNLRGIKSYENEDFEEARRAFEENVINNPGEGALHFNLGNTYYREGELDAALSEYMRALRDDAFPHRSDLYHNIGNTLFEQQRYKEALESFRNAVISNPENDDARYNYELTRLMLQEMSEEQQQQPQSGDGEDEEEENRQQQTADAQPDDSDEGEEAEIAQQKEGEGDQPQESDPDMERKLEEAENILQTLMAREREFLEEKRERERESQPLRGKFW